MNTIYIIFITILIVSFVLGLLVTIFKNRYNFKLHKYNNSALQKDNYEYAKDYIYNTNNYNFTDKIENIEKNNIKVNINKSINENTIVIPILSEKKKKKICKESLEPILYARVDDEIIW